LIRYIVIGLALFLGFGLAFAPAGILARLVQANAPARVIDPQGTLWRGQGQLSLNHVPVGSITWDFDLGSLLRAAPGYRWTLEREEEQINGFTGLGFSSIDAAFQGRFNARSLNEWLRTYDIFLSGTFDIAPSSLTFSRQANHISRLDGQINWSGGLVRYTLSGLLNEATLPPMRAILRLSEQGVAEAAVYAQDQRTPLLVASLGENGYVKVGITKLFTKVLNSPWPGSDPDHAVVIEVEEQIF